MNWKAETWLTPLIDTRKGIEQIKMKTKKDEIRDERRKNIDKDSNNSKRSKKSMLTEKLCGFEI